MDQIKEAFTKVKQDISVLQEELFFVKKDIEELKCLMQELVEISKQTLNERKKEDVSSKGDALSYPAHTADSATITNKTPTENIGFMPLKHQNQGISIGNGGVPTDRQTNQQTNQQTDFTHNFSSISLERQKTQQETLEKRDSDSLTQKDSFKEAASMLETLDNLKRELRLKFKRLTDQEILVFSTLYQLEEEKGYTDYKSLSTKLKLTESSIRDYIGKLIKKGIPVDKIKINNKSVHLAVSPSLKKIASLPTILLLRDI